MSSRSQASMAATVEDAENDDEPAHRGVHMQNAHQSVIAETFTNEQNLNFTSHSSSAKAPGQSIYAGQVKIQGDVNYNNHIQDTDLTIARWISSLPSSRFEDKQNENTLIARKGPVGIGKWLLESEEFINWRDGEARILWCPGIPGAGKTILASIIISHIHISMRSIDSRVACIFVYFDYKTQTQAQKKQDLLSLLSSLLAQLIRQGDQIAPEIKTIYTSCTSNTTKPDLDQYLRMLKSQIDLFSKVFLVVDALDECPNDSESNTQDEFLKYVHQLPPRTHILFTSRSDISIGKKVQADAKLEIRADRNDLRKYLEHRIQDRDTLKSFIKKGTKKDKEFLRKTLDAIVEKTQGMFLLAQLHIDFLASIYTLDDFNKGILNLPQDLDNVYKEALHRIESQDDFRRKLAIDVLTWLVFTERPLTIRELTHALAVHRGDKTLNRDRFTTADMWTSACAGIVVADQASDTIRLAHYTAEKYLRDNESISKDVQSIMAETCLVYLSLDDFRQILLPRDVASRKQAYPFYSYAADHWGHHVTYDAKGGNTFKLAYEFLSDSTKVSGALQVMSHYRFQLEADITGLHISAYFGLHRLAKKLLSKGFVMNARTQSGETALHWAAFYRQQPFLKLLVEQGADLNIKDRQGRTALHKAVINDDAQSVEILLSSGKRCDLNLEDSQRWTPLRWAANYGQLAVGEALLKSGAEIDAQDKDGWTALRWAARAGDDKFVELLIQNGASLETPSKDGWTLLQWAASRVGQDRFIRLLIEKRVNLNATIGNGWTALRWAVEYGCGMAAWLLIQARVDINKADKEGVNPLHSAADKWAKSLDKSLIWLLLQNGANIDAQTRGGFTALHLAAQRGHREVVWLLLQKGSNINAKTRLGLSGLHLAAMHGQNSVASLLLDSGADTKVVDENKRTALHCAVIEGRDSVVLMLSQKVPGMLRAKDDEERTALHLAASAGNLSITLMLINHGAEVDALDRKGNTPLHFAVLQHPQLVTCLISHRTDVNITNKKGWTPLHYAASSGNIALINTLLQTKGIDTRIRNKAGQTPWELARHSGHTTIAMF